MIKIYNYSDCVNREIRLVNGSTPNEGRVEVFMDGRWGTVCNNNQEEIAEAICSQLGFLGQGILRFALEKYFIGFFNS